MVFVGRLQAVCSREMGGNEGEAADGRRDALIDGLIAAIVRGIFDAAASSAVGAWTAMSVAPAYAKA